MKLQNSLANEKVTAAFVAGAASAFLIGTVGLIWPDIAARIPTGYESALTGVLIVAAAWWKQEHSK